jgi:uncharacterized protein YlxW (UPF0749 family)
MSEKESHPRPEDETPGVAADQQDPSRDAVAEPPPAAPAAPAAPAKAAAPAKEPAAGPADKPAAQLADEPRNQPANEPAADPADRPAAQLADEPADGPADEPTAQLADEPRNQPADEPAAGPADEVADEVTDGPADEETRAADGVPEPLPPVAAEDPAPEKEKEEEPRPRLLAWSRSPAALLVGLLIGLLGFGLAVQVRSNTSTSGLPAARQEDLVRILDDLSSREDRLRRQIADLEAAKSRLSTTGDTSSTALEEARKRSDALGILAGTVPAQGPGIELTLTDPQGGLAAEDLLDTVEELRAAGAEAIQVGGVRIGLDSSFTATGRGLAVDGVNVTAPYTILAIGDPPTLATAMSIPGGVADTTKRAGGEARTEQRQQVVVLALRAIRTPRYSQPTN